MDHASSGSAPLGCQRHLFDLPAGVAWINCAQHSPALREVSEAGAAGLARKRHPWTIGPAQHHEEPARLRALFAALIGAGAGDIAIVPSVSYGLSLAAQNLALPPGRRAVLLAEQFPSNVYPWRALAARDGGEVAAVARPADGDWTAAVLAALDARTAILALPNYHWLDGGALDLPRLAAAARELGAALVLDLTQSLGAVPFDLAAVQPDFLIAGTYKWLLGPYSFALLYAAPQHRNGRPLEQGWNSRAGSEDRSRLVDYPDRFYGDARRFDMGEAANYIAVPMAIAGLEQILAWRPDRIAAGIAPLVAALAEGAAGLGLKVTPAAHRAPHFLGLRADRPLREDLLARLQDDRIYVSRRGDSLRVSPHLYNDRAEIDRLLASLARLL